VTACRTIKVDTIGRESLVMALLSELPWGERCIASIWQGMPAPRLNQTAAIMTLRKVRLRTIGTIPGPSDSSRRQLLQQRLRLLQIERIEAFREPAVDWRKQFASLLWLTLGTPEAREACCCAEFPGLGLLLTSDRERVLEVRLRRRSIRLRRHQRDFPGS